MRDPGRAAIGAAALFGVLTAAAASAGGEVHPRLYFTPERLERVCEAAERAGSVHAEILGAMKKRVAAGPGGYCGHMAKYKSTYQAKEAACLALVTGERRYADIAFGNMMEVPYENRGLSAGMKSTGIALTYDWCHGLLSEDERSRLKGKIREWLDKWPRTRVDNAGGHEGSNWVGVSRGSELMLMIASYEEAPRAQRFEYLKRTLKKHIGTAYGSLGVTQEGSGYLAYTGNFLFPAMYTLEAVRDDAFRGELAGKAWWKQVMYCSSASSAPGHGHLKLLQSGVGGLGFYMEGMTSSLIHQVRLTEPDMLPYYKWFYDMSLGPRSKRPPEMKYDQDRGGTVYALAYYPDDVEARDPTGVLPRAVGDDRGYYYFRNRWRDEDDILVSMHADAHHHSRAWDQAEALQVGLLAYDTLFFGGPGKNRGPEGYSALIVDGRHTSGGETGRKELFEPTDVGGYVIASGGGAYPGIDVRRHMLVDFSPGENAAVVSTLDVVKSGTEHEYVWQGNLGPEGGDDGVRASSGTDSGRPTFLLRGRNNGYVKGVVLEPKGATVEARDPLRIATRGSDVHIWIVMLVGSGDPPAFTVRGDGLGSSVDVGGAAVSYDAAAGRILASVRDPAPPRAAAGDPRGASRPRPPGRAPRARPRAPAGRAAATLDEKAVARWDARLRDLAADAARERRRVTFRLSVMRGSVQLVSLRGETLMIRKGGGELGLPWRNMKLDDRANLAEALASQGGETGHAVSAFFLAASGREKEAAEHLTRAGKLAAEVRKDLE